MATGDFRQSWERVPEGPKPGGPPEYTPTTEEVRGAYGKWVGDPEWFDRMIAVVRADAWDEGRKSTIEDGPDGSILVSFGDKPNPYRSEKQ